MGAEVGNPKATPSVVIVLLGILSGYAERLQPVEAEAPALETVHVVKKPVGAVFA